MTRFCIFLFAAALFGQQSVDQAAKTREFLGLGPAPDQAAAKLGEPLYNQNCAACHGQNARGAQAPNLVRSALVLHDEKGSEIGPVVKKGRPQAGMPAFADLDARQIYNLAEYLHLQIELAANRGSYSQTYGQLRNQLTGNPTQGKAFFDANCTGCHSVTKDLAGLGTKYPQATVMLNRIAWPRSKEPPQATVITKDGLPTTGTVVKLDDFDVSIREANGTLHSWSREQVQVDVPDPLSGHRALLPRYSDANLHDLTAYLAGIK